MNDYKRKLAGGECSAFVDKSLIAIGYRWIHDKFLADLRGIGGVHFHQQTLHCIDDPGLPSKTDALRIALFIAHEQFSQKLAAHGIPLLKKGDEATLQLLWETIEPVGMIMEDAYKRSNNVISNIHDGIITLTTKSPVPNYMDALVEYLLQVQSIFALSAAVYWLHTMAKKTPLTHESEGIRNRSGRKAKWDKYPQLVADILAYANDHSEAETAKKFKTSCIRKTGGDLTRNMVKNLKVTHGKK